MCLCIQVFAAIRGSAAVPLTTPIYETTTFLFESEELVRRKIIKKINKYLYSRYANPTIVVTEQKLDGA